jgi:hypothetical protein
MADDAAAAAATPADDIVDEAASAAAGTRKAAQWIASALGAIPGLAILASLVRPPGDEGFYSGRLILGVAFAAVGASLAIWAFGRVLTPVPLADNDLETFDMTRVPGYTDAKFADLTERITRVRNALGVHEDAAIQAEAEAKRADAEATQTEAAAKAAAVALAANPKDEPAKRAAAAAQTVATGRRETAATLAGEAASKQETLALWSRQYAAREALRSQAFRLKAADVIEQRFSQGQKIAAGAVALVAIGVMFLALAPKPKATSAAAPTLVSLTLNENGQKALGCTEATLQAIRVGGDDKAPVVITLPTAGCPSKSVTFVTTTPSPLGSVSPAPAVTGP